MHKAQVCNNHQKQAAAFVRYNNSVFSIKTPRISDIGGYGEQISIKLLRFGCLSVLAVRALHTSDGRAGREKDGRETKNKANRHP